MKINVRELSGTKLAYYVAITQNLPVQRSSVDHYQSPFKNYLHFVGGDDPQALEWIETKGTGWFKTCMKRIPWKPQEDWLFCGQAIDRYNILLTRPLVSDIGRAYQASTEAGTSAEAIDPKVAICRLVVRLHFGLTVEELVSEI